MATTKNIVLKIDVISDTICPWCFIGKRRLEKAMRQFTSTHPNVSFDVEWHPFQLSPTMSKTNPKPKMEHYIRKFGEERANAMVPYIKSVGEPEGISFSYGGVMANTLDSHRLIHWSRQFGCQNQVVEELFRDYFEREQNIGDASVLAAAAERAGIDKNKALSYLKSDQDVDSVRAAVEENRINSMGGVPNYKIQHKFTFPGAQEPASFVAFFEKALQQLQSTL
ncbi:dsba oxidoreductase [Lichtheimia corymbifera JMRC:FSU:9682]|uniref:Dsba oxidoreductase n=1 Tax=Lichtheimia corymbifera JMRC:FSU:9682 TaxID=1263082 RepID=A0A068RWR4_9FUNG|nr:dsba oxidoreductase [Lichtheimia corymbifera JMRC:FSU:9682]